ncbi:hypothetical protein BDY19DRAFT_993145 [Irpex rosettiformis]|uniref:Uncharacterized protein n=1 Tax=Irpex rosettiformis TaxID=378272 RepID=A0ACB8U5M5_9APHY|nr:hypothetical protein BDY19DRAFT_993145 [Irpex rosettiformis]
MSAALALEEVKEDLRGSTEDSPRWDQMTNSTSKATRLVDIGANGFNPQFKQALTISRKEMHSELMAGSLKMFSNPRH